VVAEVADRGTVMHEGYLVEAGTAARVLEAVGMRKTYRRGGGLFGGGTPVPAATDADFVLREALLIMCGRFTQNYTWAEVHAFRSVFGPPRNLQPHYNISPTDTVDVIRLDKEGKRELVPMRWGLVPAWWKKSIKEVPATFNARGIRRR
jgi:SOS response associated peptidase (SRAP)